MSEPFYSTFKQVVIDGKTIPVYESKSIWAPIIVLCHNKRVKHLYTYGKTARVRKKNKKRAINLGLEWLCVVNERGGMND